MGKSRCHEATGEKRAATAALACAITLDTNQPPRPGVRAFRLDGQRPGSMRSTGDFHNQGAITLWDKLTPGGGGLGLGSPGPVGPHDQHDAEGQVK